MTNLFAETISFNPIETKSVSSQIRECFGDYTIIEVNLNNFQRTSIDIDSNGFYQLSLIGEGVRLEKGNPELPVIG